MYKPTVKDILNLHTGEHISPEIFFQQPEERLFEKRRENETYFQQDNPLYVCSYCLQPLSIAGNRGGTPTIHFKHRLGSGDCPYKSPNLYTKEELLRMKYNGVKESQLHKDMKLLIMRSLLCDPAFSDVAIEKTVRHEGISKKWKRPDVVSKYNQQEAVFEIQLSTTFLSVIVERDLFYKDKKSFIVWIFNTFHTDFTEQRFTEKDILYANRNNVFIVDETTYHRSEETKTFILHCYYLEPFLDQSIIQYRWKDSYVAFHELLFDYEEYKVYLFDSKKAAANLEIERSQRNKEFIQQQEQFQKEKQQQESLQKIINISKYTTNQKDIPSTQVLSQAESHKLSNEVIPVSETITKQTESSGDIETLNKNLVEINVQIRAVHQDIMNLPSWQVNNHPLGKKWAKLLAEQGRIENKIKQLQNT